MTQGAARATLSWFARSGLRAVCQGTPVAPARIVPRQLEHRADSDQPTPTSTVQEAAQHHERTVTHRLSRCWVRRQSRHRFGPPLAACLAPQQRQHKRSEHSARQELRRHGQLLDKCRRQKEIVRRDRWFRFCSRPGLCNSK